MNSSFFAPSRLCAFAFNSLSGCLAGLWCVEPRHRRALRKTGWNQTEVARTLGIPLRPWCMS
ncbi:helix-turn-helix domain-containing protein [Sorangium cellulosum]|uniref:helix-turn-helix domain-containing protein n=1 Tax=Sorangium cellulosum TaxID=56 RepID=UPI003D9A6DE9